MMMDWLVKFEHQGVAVSLVETMSKVGFDTCEIEMDSYATVSDSEVINSTIKAKAGAVRQTLLSLQMDKCRVHVSRGMKIERCMARACTFAFPKGIREVVLSSNIFEDDCIYLYDGSEVTLSELYELVR